MMESGSCKGFMIMLPTDRQMQTCRNQHTYKMRTDGFIWLSLLHDCEEMRARAHMRTAAGYNS